MISQFLEEAELEFFEAAEWYESQQSGLGVRFRNEIALVVGQIEQNPFRVREREGGYRRINCPVFPYFIPYVIRRERIILAAVAHASRHPDYWKSRLKS